MVSAFILFLVHLHEGGNEVMVSVVVSVRERAAVLLGHIAQFLRTV